MVNLSGYYTEVENYQDRIVIDNFVTMKSAAKAKIFGAEAEMRTCPLPGLDIIASLGLLNAEYVDYTDTQDGQIVRFDSNSIALVPDFQYNVVFQYRFPLGIYLRGEIFGIGKFYFARENTDRLNLESYETERFDIYAYGKNLSDEYYYTQLSDVTSYGVPGVTEMGSLGDPLSFRIMVNIRF